MVTHNMMSRLVGAFLILITGLMLSNTALACTGLSVVTEDGAVIFARTMEFAIPLDSEVIVVPRNQAFSATLMDGKTGLKWSTKYGYLGANLAGRNHIVEGFNEKGLHVGVFYLPGYTKYEEASPADYSRTLGPLDFADWLLGNFATVQEAKANIHKVKVIEVIFEKLGKDYVPPLHWIVLDPTGDAIVIEYINGHVKVYDNPLRVITNAPPFDWHTTNLRNYVNLTAANVPPIELSGLKLSQTGQGSGMLGLPGDFTPPSRFVRAVALTQSAEAVKTDKDGVNLAWLLISNITIPIGATRDRGPAGKEYLEHTQWGTVSDLKNKRFYFRTYYNQDIRVVDLTRLDLDADQIRSIPMEQPASYKDVTRGLK